MKIVRWFLLMQLGWVPQLWNQAIAAESQLRVETVECRGNVATSCDFIKRRLRIQLDSAVDDDDVQNAQLRLSSLPSFESVRVYLEKGSEVGKVNLIVEVVEASSLVTEFAFGAQYRSTELPYSSDRDHSWSDTVLARIGDQNLFGRQKITSLLLGGSYDWAGSAREKGAQANLIYIDPNLFGTDRFFGSASAGFLSFKATDRSQFTYPDPIGNLQLHEGHFESNYRGFAAGVAIGYRIWSYSFFFADYAYQNSHSESKVRTDVAFINYDSEIDYVGRTWRAGLGWDSEDDAYFPTEGARLSVSGSYIPGTNCFNCKKVTWGAAYKQNWSFARSIVTFNLGGTPASSDDRLRPLMNPYASDVSLTYSYSFAATERLGVRRGRIYVQAGTGPFELRSEGRIGGHPDEAAIAVGLRVETRTLGLIDIFVAGSRTWPRDGR